MSSVALVVRGGWTGHVPEAATDVFLPFLRAHGFVVEVESDPQVYADAERLAATDLILQCVTMSEIGDDALAGLRSAVAAGTGLAGWHGGIADSYRSQADFAQLVGGQFVAHPGGDPAASADDGTRAFLTHTVELTSAGRSHEITAGLEDFELTTEQYWVLTDELNDVLATTTHPAPAWQPWRRPVTVPAVWTRRWGRGRVFVATPGHDAATLEQPSVRTIIERGLLWASRTASE